MLGSWSQHLVEMPQEFLNADPFPLLVIDGFLDEDVADGLLSEFPSIEGMEKSHDYIFGDKHQSTRLADAGPFCGQYHDLLLSEEFAGILKTVTDRDLFVDPSFHGGGFHQGGDGSYLDTHVDFNLHPDHDDWLRVLNILLFLNKDWPPEYGGDLLVRTKPSDEPRVIAPRFNRGVIMLTSESTYHGYRRMSLPLGATRKSIAAYAYELVPAGSLHGRTTSWSPEDAGFLKRTLGRHWAELAAARTRILGRR